MRNLKKIILMLLPLAPLFAAAQAIDNTLSFKNINENKYFRLNYENDVFSGQDMYFTQGFSLEAVTPWAKLNPLTKLLIHPKYNEIRYGLGFEHNGYTPSSIGSEYILYGDRPFAATMFIKSFLMAIDSSKKQRFSSSISTGIIGQAALGREMQVQIHDWLNNITPHGWQYQLNNDIVLNYQAGYEKQLVSYKKKISLDADCMARLGTLSDKLSAGATFMVGYFDSPFSGYTPHSGQTSFSSQFRIYAYEHPEVSLVGYDATMQGGMFETQSPFTIDSKDITRYTFQNRFGFVVIYRRIYLEYFQSYITSEFKNGNYHAWGGVEIGFEL